MDIFMAKSYFCLEDLNNKNVTVHRFNREKILNLQIIIEKITTVSGGDFNLDGKQTHLYFKNAKMFSGLICHSGQENLRLTRIL